MTTLKAGNIKNSRFFKNPSAVIYVDWRNFAFAEAFCMENFGDISKVKLWNYYYHSTQTRRTPNSPSYVKSQGYYFEFNTGISEEFLVEFTMRFST